MSKYPRTHHLKYSKGVTSDDKIANDSSNLIGSEIVITEKLDGSNSSLTKGGVYARSHAVYSENPWDKRMWNIHNRVFDDIPEETYIFGENMEGIHSIEYSGLKSYFYMFGVRENNIWVNWDKVEEWSFYLDIPIVPILFKGVVNSDKELQTLVEKLVSEPSALGGEREGVVARTTSLFHNDDFEYNVQKWVRANHVTADDHWTRSWKKARVNY